MLFTFRRDAEGRETIHVGDVAIASITDGPEGFEWLASPPAGIAAEHVREASVKADEAGFWFINTYVCGPGADTDVNVPVAETTSTILSLTTEDEQ